MKRYLLLMFLSVNILSQAQITLTVHSQINTVCNGNPCNYKGPSILINEVMLTPSSGDGSIYDMDDTRRGEWFELYNPDLCKSVDVSCYYLGNNAFDETDDYGGGYRIPPNTIVPPRGFVVIRGTNTPAVPSNLLVKNGGTTIELIADDGLDNVCISTGGNRLWFPNAGGWFAFYNKNGVPQDAISWCSTTNSCMSCAPCIASCSGCSDTTSLLPYSSIPAYLETYITPLNPQNYPGQSWRRIPDGGTWSSSCSTPTMGTCNSTCIPAPVITCNGMAWVTPSGGVPPYSYKWNDSQATTKDTAKGLCAGIYRVTVTDSDNNTDTISVQIKNLSLTVKVNPESPEICVGDSVTLTATAEAATGFIWSPASGLNVTTGNIVIAKPTKTTVYKIKAFSAYCSDSLNFTITVDPLPNVTVSPAHKEICFGDTVHLQAFGASSYSWSPATGLNTSTGSFVIAKPTGSLNTYIVKGKNYLGCSDTASVNIIVNPLPFINLGKDTAFCQGKSIVLYAGGSGELYKWQDNSTNDSLIVNKTGVYSVTVTDTKGCFNSDTVKVSENALPAVNIIPDHADICKDSTLSLIATGAYTYIWSPATGLSSTTGNHVTAHPAANITYTTTGTDIKGCINKDSLIINVKVTPIVSVTPSHKQICIGDTVHLLAYGASTYSWSPATGLNASTGSSVILSTNSLKPETLNLKLIGTNSTGCWDTASVNIIINPLPVVNLGKDTAFCKGKSIVLNAGGAGENYKWQDNSTNETLTVNNPGVYSVTVTDTKGCINSDSVKVLERALPVIFLSNDSICPGTSTTLNPHYDSTATYTWQDNGTDLACKVSTLTVNTPGTYSVTVTDIHNCSSSATANVSLYPLGKLNLGQNDTINEGDPFPVLNPVSSYTKYTWQDGSGNPTYNVIAPGKYWLTVKDKNKCILSDTIIIYETCKVKDVFVPNVFLPDNGTSCNVTFMIEGRCLGNVDVTIYNRWGVKISWDNYDFTINQPDNNNGNCNDMSHQDIIGEGKIHHYIIWDGIDKRNGNKAGEGAYFYVIKYNFRDNPNTSTQIKKGSITILR